MLISIRFAAPVAIQLIISLALVLANQRCISQEISFRSKILNFAAGHLKIFPIKATDSKPYLLTEKQYKEKCVKINETKNGFILW